MTIAPRKPVAVLVLALALAGVAGTAPVGARAGASDSGSSGSQVTTARSLGSSVLQLINAERRTHGLKPLRLSQKLGAAAAAHARSMGVHGYFSHTSYDGTSFDVRIHRYFRGSMVGETMVWRSPELTPQEAVAMWMGSSEHRAILLNGRLTEIGLGAVSVQPGTGVYQGLDPTILVADFGTP